MSIRFSRILLNRTQFPDCFLSTIRLGVTRIKEKLHCIGKHLCIEEISHFFRDRNSFSLHESPAQSPLKLSKVYKEQQRILKLTYSCTTAFEPVNFDLFIFFVTSPPSLNQEKCYVYKSCR